MLRLTVSRPVYLGVKPHLRSKTRFLVLSDSCEFVDGGRFLWREDGSVVYNCCWPSTVQSFSGPSPTGIMTTFYSSDSRLPQPGGPGPLIYIPKEQVGPRHCVPFSSPPTTRRATVVIQPQHGSHRKRLFHYCVFSVARETMCRQSSSLATPVLLSPVYTTVTWQWVYMSQYETNGTERVKDCVV
jgi:hypothetical protein